MTDKNIQTFLGCDNEYDESKIVIFGTPFDSTSSFRPGSRFASSAMRNESYGIETYSPYVDKDLDEIKVFDGGDIELPFGNAEKSLNMIEKYCDKIFDDNKIPCMIGGEHLVTLGAVKSAIKKYPELVLIQFDAHADLRDDYLGEKLSHATVMRRCFDILGKGNIYQFGIRSGEKAEFEFAKENHFLNKFNFNGLESVAGIISDKPVYLTIDLDVIDPSEFPGTGTPEAGGVSFTQLLEAVIKLSPLNIIGFDINELSPPYDHSGASTALACKVLRELLLVIHS